MMIYHADATIRQGRTEVVALGETREQAIAAVREAYRAYCKETGDEPEDLVVGCLQLETGQGVVDWEDTGRVIGKEGK